jgi:hypothetical protein
MCCEPSKNSPWRFKTLQCSCIQIFRIFWKILRMLKINTKTQELKFVTCNPFGRKNGWQRLKNMDGKFVEHVSHAMV